MVRNSFSSPSLSLRGLIVVLAASALSACADPASLALGGVSAVTFVHSGKTLTDHAMSAATDQDCSIRNSLNGKPWCLPVTKPRPDASNPETANLHCYRSIATMTCYRHKNLHDTASRYTASEIRQQNAEIAESFMAETE